MTSTCRSLTAAVLAGAAALTAAFPAGATPPGENGDIAFRRFLGPADNPVGSIFTIRPDGGGERRVTRPPRGSGDDFPDFAGDGSLIAFDRCAKVCRIMVVRPDGSGLRRVTPVCDPDRLTERCGDDVYPALSPDGRRVAFAHAFGRVRKDMIDHVGIYTSRLDGRGLRRVTLPRTRRAEDGEVQWSPDGRRLVFVRKRYSAKGADRGGAVFVVDADGSGLRRITPWRLGAGDGPDWSPDGSRILFRAPASDDFLGSNLFTVRPDGSGLTQVTRLPEGRTLFSASFSPDGTSITLGMQGVGDAADVYTMRADGSAIAPVTRTAARDSAPDWGGRS